MGKIYGFWRQHDLEKFWMSWRRFSWYSGTNMWVVGFRKSIYLVRKSKTFIKNEDKITSRVYCIKWAGVNFSELSFEYNEKQRHRVIICIASLSHCQKWSPVAETTISAFICRRNADDLHYATPSDSQMLQRLLPWQYYQHESVVDLQ